MNIRLLAQSGLLKVRRILQDPALFLLWVIAPLALIMVILVPPFQAPDEHTHFFKAVQLSEGKLIGHHMGTTPDYAFPLVGDYLPGKYWKTSRHYFVTNETDRISGAQIRQDLSHPSTDEKPKATPFENTVVYPPLAYIPQAITIFFTNLVDKSALVQLYAARLGALAVSLVLLYFAIKRIPFGKWAVVCLVATPMSLLLLISCSGDAITAAIIALFVAHVLAVAVGKKQITRSEVIPIAALALALGFCKSPYELLLLFIFVIPAGRFVTRRQYYKTLVAVLVLPLILAAVWTLAVNKLYINVAAGSDTAVQTHFVAGHPLSFIHALIRTYLGDAGDYVPRGFIDLSTGLSAPLPIWFVALNFIFITLIVLQEKMISISRILRRRLQVVSLALVVLLFIAINASLYITFTPVKAPIIDGLQGRYFIPVAYFLVPLLCGVLPTDKNSYQKLLAAFRYFFVLTACMAVVAIGKRFY